MLNTPDIYPGDIGKALVTSISTKAPNAHAIRPGYDRPAYFRTVDPGLEDIAVAHGIRKLSQAAATSGKGITL